MQYKHEFIPHYSVPQEYKERDIIGNKMNAAREISEFILRDFGYTTSNGSFTSGETKYTMEVIVMSADRYNDAVFDILKILSDYPDLQSKVSSILKLANLPTTEEGKKHLGIV